MAGLQQALEQARRNAVQDPHFKPLPSPTGEQPALENHHDPKVMELADQTLVDPIAEGELAQPLQPSTVRIDADLITLFRQTIGGARDKKPPLARSVGGAVVAPEPAVRRLHVENADAMR